MPRQWFPEARCGSVLFFLLVLLECPTRYCDEFRFAGCRAGFAGGCVLRAASVELVRTFIFLTFENGIGSRTRENQGDGEKKKKSRHKIGY